MLRDITIENYRCFKDFTITGLAPVNLIVGSNEIGKTSFMEAVYLLVNHRKPESLLSLLSNRGEILPATPTRYHVRHLFRGHQLNFFQKICLKSQQERSRQLEIKLSPLSPPNPEEKVEHDAPVFELIWFSEDAKFKFPGSPDGSIGGKFWRYGKTAPENIFTNHSNSSIFITDRHLNVEQLASRWDAIALTEKAESVVQALQIINPEIERITFTSSLSSSSGILVKLKSQKHPILLSSMGTGMRRAIALGISAVTAANSVFLVEEIDAGLHYEVQTDIWRLILQIAQQLKVQVFATTHSWDCICAFTEAVNELEDNSVGMLFRLSKKYGKLRPVEYTAEDLEIAVRQSIEVR
ncbi:MAG: AAA family ATPase [Hormoscilla sp. GUM202]|nr:AAA family ATPase [Hormoscilla sp. GUM202]